MSLCNTNSLLFELPLDLVRICTRFLDDFEVFALWYASNSLQRLLSTQKGLTQLTLESWGGISSCQPGIMSSMVGLQYLKIEQRPRDFEDPLVIWNTLKELRDLKELIFHSPHSELWLAETKILEEYQIYDLNLYFPRLEQLELYGPTETVLNRCDLSRLPKTLKILYSSWNPYCSPNQIPNIPQTVTSIDFGLDDAYSPSPLLSQLPPGLTRLKPPVNDEAFIHWLPLVQHLPLQAVSLFSKSLGPQILKDVPTRLTALTLDFGGNFYIDETIIALLPSTITILNVSDLELSTHSTNAMLDHIDDDEYVSRLYSWPKSLKTLTNWNNWRNFDARMLQGLPSTLENLKTYISKSNVPKLKTLHSRYIPRSLKLLQLYLQSSVLDEPNLFNDLPPCLKNLSIVLRSSSDLTPKYDIQQLPQSIESLELAFEPNISILPQNLKSLHWFTPVTPEELSQLPRSLLTLSMRTRVGSTGFDWTEEHVKALPSGLEGLHAGWSRMHVSFFQHLPPALLYLHLTATGADATNSTVLATLSRKIQNVYLNGVKLHSFDAKFLPRYLRTLNLGYEAMLRPYHHWRKYLPPSIQYIQELYASDFLIEPRSLT